MMAPAIFFTSSSKTDHQKYSVSAPLGSLTSNDKELSWKLGIAKKGWGRSFTEG